MSNTPTMTLKTSAENLAKKLYEVEELAREALESRPGAVGEDWAYLTNALADIKKICTDPFGEYRTPKEVLETVAGARPLDAIFKNPPFDSKRTTASEGRETITVEKKDWLELPRNITLKRFVNTKRETHFIGQYSNPDLRSGDTNPRRVYTIDVIPMWDEEEERDSTKAFEVSAQEDGRLLFRVTTMRGRAVAEYLGVKALKAWLNYCGSKRRGKQSRKTHNKRYRANRRARKAAAKGAV